MKKVLFFTYDFPYPTNSGGKNRAYHMLKYTASQYEIHLFSFVREDFEKKYVKNLEEIGVHSIETFPRSKVRIKRLILNQTKRPTSSAFSSLYYSKEIERKLIEYIKDHNIDIVHFESFYTGYYLSQKIKKMGVKQVFGTENIEFKLYQEYVKASIHPLLKPFYLFQTKLIEREEKAMYKKADLCVAVSSLEASQIRRMGAKKCEVVENGVDIDIFSYKKRKKTDMKNILFLGNFAYFPNIDAVRFFYKSVFLRFDTPGVTLTVVGKNASKVFSSIRDSRVEIINYVPDIKELYDNASVFVFPVRFGGGTNFKIIEAMASGVPIVGFPQRLEGFNGINSKLFLPAQDPVSFYDQMNRVFSDQDFVNQMTQKAREYVEKNYSWETIGKKLQNTWSKLL